MSKLPVNLKSAVDFIAESQEVYIIEPGTPGLIARTVYRASTNAPDILNIDHDINAVRIILDLLRNNSDIVDIRTLSYYPFTFLYVKRNKDLPLRKQQLVCDKPFFCLYMKRIPPVLQPAADRVFWIIY